MTHRLARPRDSRLARRALGRLAIGALTVAAVAFTAPSFASAAEATKIVIGTTPLADVMPAYVAKEKGFFANRGLDVSFVFIPLNPTIPAAILSNSIQVGAPNAAVFVQAFDAGLDLQLIAGSTTTPSQGAPMAYVTRADVAYRNPHDLEGLRIIMPGLGSSVDVLFRKWLIEKGVDDKKLKFVEMPSPQTDDALKAKTVDGAVVVEPFLTRVLQSGNGKVAVRFMDGLADDKIGISFVAARTWIEQNRDAVTAFRAALDEGIAWSKANQQEARTLIQPYIKLPQAVIDALPFPNMKNNITPDGVAWWIDTMKAQGRLSGNPDPAKMIAP
jgi:NitT/TauT family transport system substrate-binding protein